MLPRWDRPAAVTRGNVQRVLSALYGVWVLVAASLLALGMGTVLVLPYAFVPRGRRERYTMPGAVRWAGIVLDRLLRVEVRVRGAARIPDDRGVLVLSNHRSWLDPVVLMRHTRSNGLSKGMIAFLPFIGLMGWLTGAVFFNRDDRHARSRAREEVLSLVSGGHRLQVFPEGTRTRSGRIGDRIYLNLAMDCWKRGIPVLCCSLWRTDEVLPPGYFGAFGGREVDLRIGALLEPADFPDARTFARACWDEVVAGVNALADEAEARQGSTASSPSRTA